MCIFHKWEVKYSQFKWDYKECVKCGKRRIVEKIKIGYQPKQYPNWDKR